MKLCMGCMTNIEDNCTTCPHCGYDETTLRQESYYLDPGTVVGGKYIVGRVIRYGGYTVTYLGMDAEHNRKVFVKEYLPSDFSSRAEGETEVTIYSGDALEQFEQGLTTFLNEANRIQHLNAVEGIAKVYDCVAENDTGYVISEYVEGETLQQILDDGKVFSAEEAKAFIVKILTGLCQVHPLDIIHCDISPETIVVTAEGEIKLMDFGATRYVTTANSKSLAIILKQGYAPEEQYRSRGVRGPWTDVYALGAVMYRMITGKVPVESVDRALLDELKTPTQLGISIPQNIENAMMNALNVYQKDRTPSAQVFLEELNSAQVKRIHVKNKKNDVGKFPKWAKGLVAVLACVIVGVGGVVTYQKMTDTIDTGDSTEVRAANIIGKTYGNAEELVKKDGVFLKVNAVMYDPNQEDEIISVQNPVSGRTLGKDKKILCSLVTSKRCNYGTVAENMNGNVDSLAAYLKLSSDKCKEATEGLGEDAVDSNRQNYRDVYGITVKGKFISAKEIRGQKKDTFFTLKDVDAIYYYVSPYFKDVMKNFRGRYINSVKLAKYRGKKFIGKETPSYNAAYVSLDSVKGVGYIVNQNIAAGQTFDDSKTSELPFDTVYKLVSWSGKSPAAVKSALKDISYSYDVTIKGPESNAVITNVYALVDGKPEKVFKKDGKYKIVIETKANATPVPQATSVPKQRDSQPAKPKTTQKPDSAREDVDTVINE